MYKNRFLRTTVHQEIVQLMFEEMALWAGEHLGGCFGYKRTSQESSEFRPQKRSRMVWRRAEEGPEDRRVETNRQKRSQESNPVRRRTEDAVPKDCPGWGHTGSFKKSFKLSVVFLLSVNLSSSTCGSCLL